MLFCRDKVTGAEARGLQRGFSCASLRRGKKSGNVTVWAKEGVGVVWLQTGSALWKTGLLGFTEIRAASVEAPASVESVCSSGL